MDEFDFNVSQNDGQNPFEGHQDIVLEDNNHKDKPTDDSKNKPEQEKPSSFGVVNVPSTSPDENQNKNIDISNDSTEISKSTLDEPITTTLKRDLINILNKIKYVAVPKMTEKKLEELYNWDLWGPLIFCFLYSIALSTGNNKNNESSIFVLVFVIFWIGGFVLTFNGKFLGAQIGICQMISLLGYGMFPITVGGVIIGFCGITNIFVKLIIVLITLVWSCFASIGFIGSLVEPDKKFIAVFPVIIFLLSLSMFSLNY
jgi:hypothetical protein